MSLGREARSDLEEGVGDGTGSGSRERWEELEVVVTVMGGDWVGRVGRVLGRVVRGSMTEVSWTFGGSAFDMMAGVVSRLKRSVGSRRVECRYNGGHCRLMDAITCGQHSGNLLESVCDKSECESRHGITWLG